MANCMLIVAVSFINFIRTVEGYYCDNDKCLEDEFCCGENICCVSYKVWELWYFWCGILFCMFLLLLCGCFWRQRSRAYWVFRAPVPYSPLSVEEEAKYNHPGRGGPYNLGKDHAPGPYYSPMPQKQTPWYSPHTQPSVTEYTDDADILYDTGTAKKSDY